MMKQTLGSFLLLVLLLSISNTNAQSKTKEEAVNKVFKALQQKDEKAWVKIFPDAATTAEFMKKLFAMEEDTTAMGMDELMKMLMEKLNDSSLYEEYAGEFRILLSGAERIGLDFSKAKLVKTVIDSSWDGDAKLPTLSGKIYFDADQKEYFLAYKDILLFENKGWYGVEVDRIDEKSRENEPPTFHLDEMDSTQIFMDSSAAVVDTVIKYDPDPKEVPVKKPANNKPQPKTKTKSPAKKD